MSTSPHDDEALRAAAEAAHACTACPLYEHATQVVFGRGPATAQLLLIGEQPGDREDTAGEPFVGPAGGVLWACLADAGVERSSVYVTNAVKHFKFEQRGKRRIHQKPNWTELAACRPWLDAELELLRPKVIVALGATAAQSLLGKSFRVTQQRGEAIAAPPLAEWIVATVHPSSIIRQRDEAARHAERQAFVRDLNVVAALL